MEALDRRQFLGRAAGAALALGGAATWTGSARAASPGSLRSLARSLDGDLITRSSSRYREAKRLYDTRFDTIRPLAIAYCRTVADVQRCVRWCARNGVRPAARSGGHSYGGYSTAADGLVIDVSRLDRIVTFAAGAEVGAGATLDRVYQKVWELEAAIPAGVCPTVGIAGIALGGGVGYSSRKLGLTCDALQELTIVTADGRVRTCNEDQNADLFWACRGGGGGNFGVVTDLVFMTYPVSTVTTYAATWPWGFASAVVDAWQRFAPDAPDELVSVCKLATGSGGPQVGSSGQFFGSEADLRGLLAPLIAAGEPSELTLTERSFIQAVGYFSDENGRATFAATSDYVREPLPQAGIDVLVRAIESRQAAGGESDILLDPCGGAINRVAPSATAFVHRRERFLMQELAIWQQGSTSGQAAGLRWLSDLRAVLRPYVSGSAYQNYVDPSLHRWAQAYYGANYPRLQRIKRRVDPGNLFRFEQSIRPGG